MKHQPRHNYSVTQPEEDEGIELDLDLPSTAPNDSLNVLPSENDIVYNSSKTSNVGRRLTTVIVVVLVTIAIVAIGSIITLTIFQTESQSKHDTDPMDFQAFQTASLPEATARYFSTATISSDDGECSEIGSHILARNGNSVDAAVATAFCLGVKNPFASGIGGGGVMTVYTSNHTLISVDFREEAPSMLASDAFNNGNSVLSLKGGLAVGVPGEVAGYYHAYRKYGSGKISWRELIRPSIILAKDGFSASPLLAMRLKQESSAILNSPRLRMIFAPNGELLNEKDIVVMPALAATLQSIADYGISAIYSGSGAETIANDIKEAGGILLASDLKTYRVMERDILSSTWYDYTVFSSPPPFSGACVLLALNVVQRLQSGEHSPASCTDYTRVAHHTIEALKFAFAFRSTLGDPKNNNTILNHTKIMINATTASDIASLIINQNGKVQVNGIDYFKHVPTKSVISNDSGTAAVVAVDDTGGAVALTTTINTSFGSKVMTSSGIILNNQMNDFGIDLGGNGNIFGLPVSNTNLPRSGNRPLSSMSPTILVQRNKVVAVIAASGGPTIISSIVSTLVNVFVCKLSPLLSVSCPRFHNQLSPNLLKIENGWKSCVLSDLANRGHEVSSAIEILADGHGIGNVQMIVRDKDDNQGWIAIADKRKMGRPSGF